MNYDKINEFTIAAKKFLYRDGRLCTEASCICHGRFMYCPYDYSDYSSFDENN